MYTQPRILQSGTTQDAAEPATAVLFDDIINRSHNLYNPIQEKKNEDHIQARIRKEKVRKPHNVHTKTT